MWYKQRLEHAPLEVGSKLEDKPAVFANKFDKSRFKLNRIASGISLSIERVTKEDEGMYFCGETGKKTLDFSTATFLAVTGQVDISVLQTPVQGSVSPGESVTLQCTVLSEIRAAELRVLWFRAAAGQSFPEIIYTHQNSSSRQCEISSSTHSSVYNFSKNILDHHHTGTYYCAVAACGKIIFGNGASVELNPAQAVDLSKVSFVSAEPGGKVTLHSLLNTFGFADEGMYFCGILDTNTITFSSGKFLAVTGQPELKVSVVQTPVWGSVSPGELVTLQCTVHSEIRAAELRVLWFRAAAGQSFPEIIYTHQNSSSRQCEISSSTHKCVHNFSKNILDHHHTGTYYCAVAACGKIVFGNRASIQLKGPVDPVVIFLGAALGVCVVVISAENYNL
ncbi:uncharacterized protein LOC118806532 [Colossoma macropomum]|uniref:uncharacterized protein LOC118806532 n=1 Tax=Colossoma macropomum TaxID=42526 RepID=UPI001863B2DC|nr:uncharacterized protein LOC118806532 [Colossoma macropomum]